VQAQFGTAHTVGAQTFQLPSWTGSFTQPLANLEQSLAGHWDQHMAPFIASLAYPMARKLAPLIGVVAGILLLFIGVSAGFSLGAAAIVGGVWGLIIYNGAHAAKRNQDTARQLLETAKTESLHQLRGASAELTDWYEKFRAADQVEAQVRELIKSLPTAGEGASPFEGRTVRKEP
jgi:hypothetical protein